MRKSEYMLEREKGGGKQATRPLRLLTYLLETQLLGKCALTSDETRHSLADGEVAPGIRAASSSYSYLLLAHSPALRVLIQLSKFFRVRSGEIMSSRGKVD